MNGPSYNQTLTAIFYNNPDEYPPIINGVRLLAQAGWQVSLLCRDNGKQWNVAYPKEVRVERIRGNKNSSWLEYLGFLRQVLLRNHKHSRLFIGHDMHGLLPARLLATRFQRHLTYHCHEITDPSRRLTLGSSFVSRFERRFARSSDLIIVPDKDRAEKLAMLLHLRTSPLVVANAPLRRPISSGDRLRDALAAQGNQFEKVVFRQGRIGPGHALEPTLYSLLHWTSNRWGLVIMGTSDREYLKHLNSIASRLGVSGQFASLPPVGYDLVPEFTSGADVGHGMYEPFDLTNTYTTTSSNKTMEYMAAGVPLLVSDMPSLRHLVETYQCGITAKESSPESIAAAINLLLESPVRAAQMGKAGRRAFEEVFCYERQFAPVLKVFLKLCSA